MVYIVTCIYVVMQATEVVQVAMEIYTLHWLIDYTSATVNELQCQLEPGCLVSAPIVCLQLVPLIKVKKHIKIYIYRILLNPCNGLQP